MVRINSLIIICGPSCSGKSYLIRKIKEYKCPQLCKQLGIATPDSWQYLHADELAKLSHMTTDRIIVHYDSEAQHSFDCGFRYLPELIDNSDRVTVVTLHISTKILVARCNLRLMQTLRNLLLTLLGIGDRSPRKLQTRISKLWAIRTAYKLGYDYILYKKWLDYFEGNSVADHFLLDMSSTSQMIAEPYQSLSYSLDKEVRLLSVDEPALITAINKLYKLSQASTQQGWYRGSSRLGVKS